MRELTLEEHYYNMVEYDKQKARERSKEGICSICGRRNDCKMRQKHHAFTEECGMYKEDNSAVLYETLKEQFGEGEYWLGIK